jgi:Icc-related predicted phosphoesterase
MRIRVMSDLHNEFGHRKIEKCDYDILVAAGDIDVGSMGAKYLMNLNKPVIYVPGNHEYYHHDIIEVDQDISKMCAGSNVRFLQNKKSIIGNVRFLGTTLWTDFEYYKLVDYYKNHARKAMNDYTLIKYDGVRFTPNDNVALHRKAVKFLEINLKKYFDGVTIVVTHHAPLKECTGKYFKNSPLNPVFCSDLSQLINKYNPDVWIYGHLHSEFADFYYGNTRLISNPMGYPGENSPFLSDYTFVPVAQSGSAAP